MFLVPQYYNRLLLKICWSPSRRNAQPCKNLFDIN